MRILAIDYGRKKIGLAVATTMLAEAYGVVRCKSSHSAIEKIRKVVEKEKIEKIVVGLSEGKMAKETKRFAEMLGRQLDLPIYFQDESLSTQRAQDLSIQAGVKRRKRKEFEDAYTAALILQDYLDFKGERKN